MIILLRGSKQLIDRDNNASSTLFILLLIIMKTIWLKQEWNSMDDTPSVGIFFFQGLYIALWYSVSKDFKTENGARKWMRKFWYDC